MLFSQPTYQKIAADTIIIAKSEWGTNIYLLGGKRIKTPVMQWFMSDHPKAYDAIKIARTTSIIRTFGYSVSGLFLFSGVLIYDENRIQANDLIEFGAYFAGGAIVFHVVSEMFKKRASNYYNESIKNIYSKSSPFITTNFNSIGIVFHF